MVVKDHFTKFSAAFSISHKMSKYVAFELEKYFSIDGYPTIFHTDNGNKFVVPQIIDMIADINPAIIAVTGRPRTHRDQGSVERANQTVKELLLMCVLRGARTGKMTIEQCFLA